MLATTVQCLVYVKTIQPNYDYLFHSRPQSLVITYFRVLHRATVKLETFLGPVADTNLSDMGTKSDTDIPKWAKNLATSNMDYEKVVTSI